MENVKLKLKNILHSAQYCGICLENDNNISALDDELEIMVKQCSETKTLQDIIDVVFRDVSDIFASSYICYSCIEKLMQSYIFIENAKETSQIINSYINDLYSKSNDIFNHLTNSGMESTNVVIVLENKIASSLKNNEKGIYETPKDKTLAANTEIGNNKKGFIDKNKCSKFECMHCNIILPTFKELKIHKVKCKKEWICKVCSQTFSNKQCLNIHMKEHNKIMCEVCNEMIYPNKLSEHHETYHQGSYQCSNCKTVFQSVNILKIHENTCLKLKENVKCTMCQIYFMEEELRFHNCRYGCIECSEIPCIHQKYLTSYKEQILNNAENIKCPDCDYVCRNKEILLGHVNKKHLNYQPYTCDKCGQQFYSKYVLRGHLHRFHEEYFLCQYCGSEFSNLRTYESHVKGCEEIKRRFNCDNCPASFECEEKLLKHQKHRHSSPDIFPCGLCNIKFLKESKRKEHMVKVHSTIQSNNKLAECHICQAKFDTKKELVAHMKSHGANIKYPCRICNTEYDTLRQFKAHYRKHKGPFATCHVCGKQMREILIKKHLTTHREAIETCETCGRSFPNITMLKYHQKIHLENVPCPKCKKMINPSRLRRHWKTHLAEENPAMRGIKTQKPNLKCQQCDYKTWNNTLLDCHMNRHHLKVKPYVCHICSKDFIGKHLLKKHIENHEFKSVVCMVCLKSFANSTCLKMHLRIHTGEKPFTCEICGDRFRSSSIMNVHKLKKHSVKNNACPLCSTKFFTVRDLRRHVIKVHWKHKNKPFDPRQLKGLDEEHYHIFHDGRRVKVSDSDVDFYMPC